MGESNNNTAKPRTNPSEMLKLCLRSPAGEDDGASCNHKRRERRDVYEALNRELNSFRFGRFAWFLNYGYVPNRNPTFAVVTPREGDYDLNSRRLVLEVLGRASIEGKDIVDVSCGRGSVAVVLQDYFRCASYLGIDLSGEAIAFCRKQHQAPWQSFMEGDAESLPLEDSSCDVVVNIEASHNYPSPLTFFREVYRVLRPSGWFQYADLLTAQTHREQSEILTGMGFDMTRRLDITSNILKSCDETATRRLKSYKDPVHREYMANFLAAPGSEIYTAMADGVIAYYLFTFVKSAR